MVKLKNIIQIAGVHDWKEAKILVDVGTDFIGFPLRLDVNEEYLTDEEAAEVIGKIGNRAKSVLITYLETAVETANLCKKIGATWVQFHADLPVSEVAKFRQSNSKIGIIKSLVISQDNFAEIEKMIDKFSPFVDAFITDTYDPNSGARGATGKIHDWKISRKIVEISPKPIILAGGLNPENVSEAIQFVHPAGVDVHSGVTGKDKRKIPKLVQKFVQRAKEAFDKQLK
ncbi:MAG: phosphoribosylanthranilate isomerase [Candidatus Marinimicrobia bacterium]|nr:phosphoribosylanthranilate isomerase [Candidatus Neomarinimicrobiota bacterium]